VGLEPGEIDVQADVTDRQCRRHCEPAFVGRKRDRLTTRRCDDYGRLRNSGTGFVNHDQPQLCLVARVLGGKWRSDEQRQEHENDPRHFVNVFALKLGLIL
jgi:hypothetical protein